MTGRAVLQTARLRLRPLAAGDEAALVAAINDLEIARWLYVVPHPYGSAEFRDFLPLARAGEVWAIEDSNGFAGMVANDGELGYWLARRVWGRGYATEASLAVLAEHFGDAGAGAVASAYFEGNERSRNVLQKLGFEPVGHDRVAPVSRQGETVVRHRMCLTGPRWRGIKRMCP
jgi:RimJ/RimL family protein N-acetyltransferase